MYKHVFPATGRNDPKLSPSTFSLVSVYFGEDDLLGQLSVNSKRVRPTDAGILCLKNANSNSGSIQITVALTVINAG